MPRFEFHSAISFVQAHESARGYSWVLSGTLACSPPVLARYVVSHNAVLPCHYENSPANRSDYVDKFDSNCLQRSWLCKNLTQSSMSVSMMKGRGWCNHAAGFGRYDFAILRRRVEAGDLNMATCLHASFKAKVRCCALLSTANDDVLVSVPSDAHVGNTVSTT